MLIKIQLLQNHEYIHFFIENNWGRSEKMDKNKCPFL